MSFDPGQVMADVDTGATRLEKAADTYSAAVLRFEKAEEVYEREMALARTMADAGIHASTGKMPSQDRRQDLALKAVQRDKPEVYTEYFAAKAEKEALAVRYRALSAAVSARQSLLKALSGA